MVEEGERLGAGVRLQPQRHPAEIHREGIPVHAVNAMRDCVARGFAHPLGRGLLLAATDAGELLAGTNDMHRRSIVGVARAVRDGKRETVHLVGAGVIAELVAQKAEERDDPGISGEGGRGIRV